MARRRSGGGRRHPRGGGRSSGITVTIHGLPELRRRLEQLPTEVRAACFRALKESAGAIVDGTKGRVKVDSANLQGSVKARYENSKLRAEIGWWDRDDRYAIWQEFGTRKMPANPSLGPSLEEEKRRLPERLKREIRKATQ
ncbi:HK97-gp10 family putative phage morphogenesis protein [Streptomyces prasinopilosus]|uniref:HK97-gp10 family putative phage morphogenesis protein n=1 Tax=Streptomyces prasinopilosus TaxID=67344 RepID=UPI0006EB653D|nr:HK97-gp10 family putative phage morphogenesis protein [Streptomyces prasinopilosus]